MVLFAGLLGSIVFVRPENRYFAQLGVFFITVCIIAVELALLGLCLIVNSFARVPWQVYVCIAILVLQALALLGLG
jgi:hypothetical protein